jgi:hypothetical protein
LKISAGEFAKTPGMPDFSLAEAKKSECRAYIYEGKLNGIESAAVLLPHPKESFGKPASLRAFICADASLDVESRLYYYDNLWYIETFFSQAKGSLGFGRRQIRSNKGMERLWTPASPCRPACRAAAGAYMPFGSGLRKLRNENARNPIKSIYDRGRGGGMSELQGVLSELKSESENIVRFRELLRKYTQLSELTAPVLNDLIDHIAIYGADGKGKERTQKIEIYYLTWLSA